MAVELIDTHTHLDDDAFGDDLEDVIALSRSSGVTRWINVGYSSERWNTTLAMANRVDGMSHMLGIHPGNADDWSNVNADRLAGLIRDTHPVAVGEIGLDLYWREDNLSTQTEALEAQLALALAANLPAVIHMRSAEQPLLNVLSRSHEHPHLHFHSFDGAEGLRPWILERQCTIGVGGLMTRKGSDSLRSWIANLPMDRVALETDSPYLKPQGVRGTRNEPAYLPRVVDDLSELWSVSPEDVRRITTDNACRIFNLNQRDAS
ncbi:MAG: TatD family hydrolase [Chloroflexia bacterium]|nr:TatD family hydrolase [Chloroflexia bacterium]MDQ3614846.1 TatD family hydrolase [Chloroflexota bacterium]